MKRARHIVLAALASCALILSAVGYASAGPEDPAMSFNEAWLYADDALKAEFGSVYNQGEADRIRCNKRIGRNVVRCKPSWILGDLAFFGRLYVSHQIRSGKLKAIVDGKIKRLNEFCAVQGGTRDECLDKYRVHRVSRAKYH